MTAIPASVWQGRVNLVTKVSYTVRLSWHFPPIIQAMMNEAKHQPHK